MIIMLAGISKTEYMYTYMYSQQTNPRFCGTTPTLTLTHRAYPSCLPIIWLQELCLCYQNVVRAIRSDSYLWWAFIAYLQCLHDGYTTVPLEHRIPEVKASTKWRGGDNTRSVTHNRIKSAIHYHGYNDGLPDEDPCVQRTSRGL